MEHEGIQGEIRALMDQIIAVRYTDLKQEYDCCVRLLALAEQHNDSYAIAFAHTYFSDYYVASGNSILCGRHLLYSRNYCRSNHFDDLLLLNYLLSGVLCENTNNAQEAFDYYLDGIALAEVCRDETVLGTIYNNIAANFTMLGDHREALKYYRIAHEIFLPISERLSTRSWVVLLGNMAESLCALGDIDGANGCLAEADALPNMDPYSLSVLYIAKVHLATMVNPERTSALVDELYALQPDLCDDKNLIFEVLYQVGMNVVCTGERACTQRILNSLEAVCDKTQILHVQQFQTLRVEFWEQWHSVEQNESVYRQYYQAMVKNQKISQEVWSAGLKAKIALAESQREIQATQKSNKQLEADAYVDEVTQVYNRRYLKSLMKRAACEGKPWRACVTMIDLDYFKEYNDTYGHVNGDLALRTVAACLRDNAPEGTVVGRYGGDEYITLSFDTDSAEIERYLASVRRDLAGHAVEHRNAGGNAKVLTLSIGYCNAVVDDEDGFEELIRQADRALYMSKYNGRDGVSHVEVN